MNNFLLKTTDLNLVASLQVFGYEPSETLNGGNKTIFIYESPDGELERIKTQYFNRTLELNIYKFSQARRKLRDRIRAGKLTAINN